MLQSLHHVPIDLMDRALDEFARFLRPGGMAYISEPVYAGDFNAILRLFNDGKQVREAAFSALQRAVARSPLKLAREIHFDSISRFAGFEELGRRIIGATHSTFDVDDALHAEVKARFMPHVGADGTAEFRNPLRIDLLTKQPADHT